MSEYYTPEHIHRQFEELGKQVPRDEIVAVEQGWQSLLEEVRAGREQGLDPASPQADALLRRWDELTEAAIGRFRGNEELSTWVAEGYQTGRYQHMPGAPTPEDFAFMQRIRESQRA